MERAEFWGRAFGALVVPAAAGATRPVGRGGDLAGSLAGLDQFLGAADRVLYQVGIAPLIAVGRDRHHPHLVVHHIGYVWPDTADRANDYGIAIRAVWHWTNAQAAPIPTVPNAPRVHRLE